MSGKTASLVGATGLIGNCLLQQLLADPYFEKIRILIRRPLSVEHDKLEKKLVNFEDTDSLMVALEESDAIFVAIGTTQKKVKGDREAYRRVDFDISVRLARCCQLTGCKKFILVSSAGANSKSANFYLRLKGEVENAIRQSGIETIHIMRPSILLGKRLGSGAVEKAGQQVMRFFSFIIPSPYKPIAASQVARAMLNVAKRNEPGIYIHDNRQMITEN